MITLVCGCEGDITTVQYGSDEPEEGGDGLGCEADGHLLW